MAEGIQSVTNFLVPATGSTNAFMIEQTFSATPYFQNFNNVELNGIPFRPSGVIIDNTSGTGDLTVLINELSFAITCPAGLSIQMPYPAPVNHSVNITGLGEATVVFVDYPVVPFGGTQLSLPNPTPVSLPSASLTATLDSSSGSSSTSAGLHMVSFYNSGSANATIAGGTLAAGLTITFEAPVGQTIGAIAYNATGTTLVIATLG